MNYAKAPAVRLNEPGCAECPDDPDRDHDELLLTLARRSGLREALHGVSPTRAKCLLRSFIHLYETQKGLCSQLDSTYTARSHDAAT